MNGDRPDATAICSSCGTTLCSFPMFLRDLLPAYWLSFCGPQCVEDWRSSSSMVREVGE